MHGHSVRVRLGDDVHRRRAEHPDVVAEARDRPDADISRRSWPAFWPASCSALTVIIALDTVRRWYVLLANGAKQPEAEPVVAGGGGAGVSEGASRPSWKLQFTIAQALLATAIIGVCTGYAVNYGVGTAVVFGVLTSLLCIDLVRTVRRWKTLVLWRRVYGCVDISVLGVLLAAYVVFLACGTSPARQSNARHLQRDLQGDSRFSSVHVEYLETQTASASTVNSNSKQISCELTVKWTRIAILTRCERSY